MRYILILLIFLSFKGQAKDLNSLACTHIQVCNSLKYLLADQPSFSVKQAIELDGQDPHHFEPKVGDIKKLVQSQNLVLAPIKVQPWLKSIEKNRALEKQSKKITILTDSITEHFWLKEDSLCNYLNNLNQKLSNTFKTYVDQKQNIEKQCQLLRKKLTLKGKSAKGIIILLHDSLTGFLKNKGYKVMSLRGHGHHHKITPRSIKKLKETIQESDNLVWIIESQIHYPATIKKLIKSNHRVIEINTLGTSGSHPWKIMEDISKNLVL